MISKENFFKYLIIAIFALALLLRLFRLGEIPDGFHNDEVDVGYVGKFLVLHLRDPVGNFLPLAFDKFGDYRPTGLFYLTGISEVIFGTNVFAARLSIAFFGALTVFPLYFLAFYIFKNRRIAAVSAFFLAVLPWHLNLARAGQEAVVGYFFVISALALLIKYKDQRRRNYLILAAFCFVVSYLFYHSTRILVPALFLGFLLVWREKIVFQILIFLTVVSALILISPVGRGRLSQVVFYKNPNLVSKLMELPYADKSTISARIFHNKAMVYSRDLAGNYLQYFSADFLFLRGGYPERYIVPEAGLIFIVFAPLLILAVVNLLKTSSMFMPVIFWLLVSPFAAVFTYEDIPSVTRASFMIFPLVLVCAWGFEVILNFKKSAVKNVIIAAFFVLLATEFIYFGHQYFVHQKGYRGFFRDQGTREIVTYMLNHQNEYDLVLAQYGPNFPFYYLFYGDIFDKNIKFDIANLSENFQYKNVLFTRDGCPSHRADQFVGKKVLYIDMADCEIKPQTQVLLFVMRRDSTVAYRAAVRDLQ